MLARAGVLATTLMLLACCASPRPAGDAPPPDFSVSLTVLGGPDPAVAPAWYTVGPDNGLRVARSVRTAQMPVPPVVRVLARPEIIGVWQRCRPITQQPGAVRIADGASALPPSPAIHLHAAVLTVTSGGSVRTYLLRPPSTGTGDSTAWELCGSLAQHMATLAEPGDPAAR